MNRLFFGNIRLETVLFKRFRVVDCLGSTSVGGVYLCTLLNNPAEKVVLKVLSTKASENPLTAENFKREVEFSFRVNHVNVVKGHDFFQDEDFTAFTMEFVEHGSLADYIQRIRFCRLETILHILAQLGAGLQAIHSAGIIHRDLKPENILIDRKGNVKIADFGIAAPDGGINESQGDQIVGTMNYLSPEYIASGKFDERTDIYALGTIAYELLTGRVPFQGNSPIDSLCMKVRADAKPPHHIRFDCPASLSEVVLRAMNRNPAMRYPKVSLFMKGLSKVPINRTPLCLAVSSRKSNNPIISLATAN